MTAPSDESARPEQSVHPVTLQTRRLLLRQPTLADADAYFEMASDPAFAVFGARQPADRAAMQRALERIIAAPWAQRPEFAITWDGRTIGRVMLDMDRVNLVAMIGYGVAHAHWGRGFASEAAQAVTDYAFAALGMEKVAARVDPRNIASVRVLEKLGMQQEGLLRSQVVRRGERADRALYGLLREEWEHGNVAPDSPLRRRDGHLS